MVIEDKKFKLVRKEAEEFYKSIGKIRCPYLNEEVYFGRDGFEHLLFKSWNKTRSRSEQYTRLRLIKVVPEILKKSHTLQEYDERNLMVRQKINSRWIKRMKRVKYYVFIAIIKKSRVKIVVKEIEGGQPFFYSIYPSWRVVKKDDGTNSKGLYSGNLEID